MIPEHIKAQIIRGRNGAGEIVQFEKMSDAVYFGGEMLKEYIKPYSIQEEPEDLARRREQAINHHENYVREIAQQYTDTIFAPGAVTRDYAADKDLSNYLNDQYGRAFAGDIAKQALRMPETYVVVSPYPENSGTEEMPTASRPDRARFPRVLSIPGSAVAAICVNRFTKELDWIAFVMTDDMGRDEFWIYDQTNHYVIATEDLERDGDAKTEPHGFSRIPVVRIAWEENSACYGIGHAFLADAVRFTVALLQQIGVMIETCYYHLHWKLAVDAQTARMMARTGTGTNTPIVVGGEESETAVPRVGGRTISTGGQQEFEPKYLSLPSTPIDKLIELIYVRIPESIYRSARLRNRVTGEMASGTAKMIDLRPELKAIQQVSEWLKLIDYEICALIIEAYNGTPYEELTDEKFAHNFPATFEAKGSQEAIADLLSIAKAFSDASLPNSDTLKLETVYSVVRTILPDADSKTIAKIREELEASLEEPETPESPINPGPILDSELPSMDMAENLGKGGKVSAEDARQMGNPG